MAHACLSFVTSFLTALPCSLDGRRGGCLFRVMKGLTFKWWQLKLGSMPGASYASHANTSTFFLRNSTSYSLSSWGSWAPIWKNFSRSSPAITFSRSSHFTSSAGLLKRDAGVFDCYKPFLAMVSLRLMSNDRYQALPSRRLASYYLQHLVSRGIFHLLVKSGGDNSQGMKPRSAHNGGIWRESIYHNEIHIDHIRASLHG